MVSKSVAMYFLMLSSRWFYNGFSRLLLCCDRLIVRSLFCGVALWCLLLACGSLVACLLLACCSLVACLLLACCSLVAALCGRGFPFFVVIGAVCGSCRDKKRTQPKAVASIIFCSIFSEDYSPRWIASEGQTSAQVPHSVQTSGLIEYFSPSEIAPEGHSSIHVPQAMQSSPIT